MTATSGRSRRITSRPAKPSAASATTSHDGSKRRAQTCPRKCVVLDDDDPRASARAHRQLRRGSVIVNVLPRGGRGANRRFRRASRRCAARCRGRARFLRPAARRRSAERARRAFGRHAVAVVLNRDRDHVPAERRRARDVTACGRGLDGVRNQIDDGAPEFVGIAEDRQVDGGHIGGEFTLLAIGDRAQLFDRAASGAARERSVREASTPRRLRSARPAAATRRCGAGPRWRQASRAESPIARRQVAISAGECLFHRHVRGSQRRSQVVRQRVDEVANDVAAVGRVRLFAARSRRFVRRAARTACLLQRDARLLGKRLQRRHGICGERRCSHDRSDEHVIGRSRRRRRVPPTLRAASSTSSVRRPSASLR